MSEAQNKLLSKITTAGMVAQIGANILWESLVHPRPRNIRSVPLSAESLTPEWLTQTLCKDHPGAQVNSVSLGVESSGSTNRRAFSVTYNEAGSAAGLPTHLFSKSASGFKTRLMMNQCGTLVNEYEFHARIRPELEVEAPAVYAAKLEPGSWRMALILEDIHHTKNVEIMTPLTKVSRDRIEQMIDILAAVHARYWDRHLRCRVFWGIWGRNGRYSLPLRRSFPCSKGKLELTRLFRTQKWFETRIVLIKYWGDKLGFRGKTAENALKTAHLWGKEKISLLAKLRLARVSEQRKRLWDSPRLENEFTWLRTPLEWVHHVEHLIGYRERSIIGIERAGATVPASLVNRGEDIYRGLIAAMEVSTRRPHTHVHGDPHVGNYYITGDGGSGLLDWQVTFRGGWGHDFCYTLLSSLDIEDRRNWERDLLAHYLQRLQEGGAAAPSFDEVWTLYRQQTLYTFVGWLYTIGFGPLQPEMQPPEYCLLVIERSGAAVEDLESLKSLGL